MTGPELKQLRADLSDALERKLTAADMARLCGLPEKGGGDTIRRWEVSGPTPEATKLLRVLAMASERYPKNQFPTELVFGATLDDELRLITCTGDFDRQERSYRDNRVVFAVRT